MLGFYVTGHPLDAWMDKVRELATHNSEKLEGLERGADVAVCGIMMGIQRQRNKEGKLWASFQLEDHSAQSSAWSFTTQYERLLNDLDEEKAVMIRGSALAGRRRRHAHFRAGHRSARGGAGAAAVADLDQDSPVAERHERAEALSQLFGRKPGDAEVRLRLEKPRDFSVILDVTTRVRPDKEFRAEVERICGPESMEILAE